MQPTAIDWPAAVRTFHALGLWHATRYLATVSTVKDPAEVAHDAVQSAWLTLWRKKKFSRGLFIVTVLGHATDAARQSKPIELSRGVAPKRGRQATGERPPPSRLTDTFPVQIFGGLIGEVTAEEDTDLTECGGRLK